MVFIDPTLQKVYDTLVGNDELINLLKKSGILVTKASLYESYSQEQVEKMTTDIYVLNSNLLYDAAQVLLNSSSAIKSQEIWRLLSNRVAWDALAGALGVEPSKLPAEVYKHIIYTYKYCVVSSFFQNNRDRFIPENDFYEMEKNPAASAFYDAMAKEFDKLDVMISRCKEYMDYDTIPFDLINYLTQLLGWEKSDMNADSDTEMQFRELAKNILDIYRVKGTDYSFELFFNFLGFNIETSEYYFDRRLYFTTRNGGNAETSGTDNSEYEYYLTTANPADNVLQNIGVGEVVTPADITPQYSLHEFNELCKTYGPAAVLGYSPLYAVYDSNGDLVEYREYTGKIYKYFKTNVIYYTISLDRANPTEKQLAAVTKYLEFLTPSYVMRKLLVKTYEMKEDEEIAFDGDGKKDRDAYGNYSGFEMLDSEDWSQDFQDEYTAAVGGLNKAVKENSYNGKEEVLENWRNSVGTNDFRLPLGRRTKAVSTSRFLTGGTGSYYPQSRRLKYYILYTLDGEPTKNWGEQNVVITPYYTVPPFIGNIHYSAIRSQWNYQTDFVNLTGGDGEGGELCVKTMVRDAGLKRDVDFLTDKPIGEFMKSDDFNTLVYAETMPKVLSRLRTIQYGAKSTYKSAYEAYLYEFAQRHIHICNSGCDSDVFEKDVLYPDDPSFSRPVTDGLSRAAWNRKVFEDGLYTQDDVNSYFQRDMLKSLCFGDLVLAYSGTLAEGSLMLYRYGYTAYPIRKDATQLAASAAPYLESFEYTLKRAYVGSQSSANLTGQYITRRSLQDAQSYVDGLKARMAASPASYEMDYVSSQLFYISDLGEYYTAVKKPARYGISTRTYPSGRSHIFSSLEEAGDYFAANPDEKVNNAEFYVAGDTLYTYRYDKRVKGALIYSTADERLYEVLGPSDQDIREYDSFFGKLSIEDGKASIDLYDEDWKGYDEQADEEDFVFYNSPHRITWSALGLSGEKISRPVRKMTDADYDSQQERLLDVYTDTMDLSDFHVFGGRTGYYRTLGQKLVEEICSGTLDAFATKEKIDWSRIHRDGVAPEDQQFTGILSIIEGNMEKLLGLEQDIRYDFYSSPSAFIQDFYRMIVMEDLQKESIPSQILAGLTGKAAADVSDADITADMKKRIRRHYSQAILEIGNVLDSITKDRVYYALVANWRDRISGSLASWSELDKNGQTKGSVPADMATVYSDPLDSYQYGPNRQQFYIIDGKTKLWYNEKTVFVSQIKNIISDLKHKYGQNIRFDISDELLGKDPYSLSGKIGPYRNYSYVYSSGGARSSIDIDTDFYMTRDSIYNFYIPYSLNYGLGSYSKDFYGEHRDIYSEFTELFDLLLAYAKRVLEEEK